MTKGFPRTDAANATAGSDRETATTIPSRIFRCITLPLENRLAALATFRPPSCHFSEARRRAGRRDFPVDGRFIKLARQAVARAQLSRPAFASLRRGGLRFAARAKAGGRCRDRTCDPLHVKEVLFR